LGGESAELAENRANDGTPKSSEIAASALFWQASGSPPATRRLCQYKGDVKQQAKDPR